MLKIADICVDLEEFCQYNPDCKIAQVKSQCPKLCGVCDTGEYFVELDMLPDKQCNICALSCIVTIVFSIYHRSE